MVRQQGRGRSSDGQRSTRNNGSASARGGEERWPNTHTQRSNSRFTGQSFECKQFGHKKADCPWRRATNSEEFVFSAKSNVDVQGIAWLLDSGASSHITGDRADFVEFRPVSNSIGISVVNGQRLAAAVSEPCVCALTRALP